jgi:predicted amidohydrolase YtcJ
MTSVRAIRDAEVDGRRVDVRIEGGSVFEIVPTGGALSGGGDVIDAHGGALLPGLHDHHVHLLAMAAAHGSVAVGPADVRGRDGLAAALRGAASHPDGWVRAVGYHEAVAGDLDRDTLDALVPDRPVRVQHRSGARWMLNSAALTAVGSDDPTGRLFRKDTWLRERVPRRPLDLAAVGRRLAAYGVTGVTDLTPGVDAAEAATIGAAVACGDLPLRVTITGGAALPATAAPELPRGPVKVLLADHEPPSLDELLARYRAARAAGRAVAVHCVTREALVLAVVAWHEVGAVPGDRVEHGAVVPPELFADLAALGVVVVTQPSFVRERGDQYLTDVEVAERPHLWRCASLVEAGIPVAFGSDAPYGPADPWGMVRDAVARRTLAGQALGAAEAITPDDALAMLLGPADAPSRPRQVAVGAIADLCLLDRSLADMLSAPTAEAVATTIVAGRVTSVRPESGLGGRRPTS